MNKLEGVANESIYVNFDNRVPDFIAMSCTVFVAL